MDAMYAKTTPGPWEVGEDYGDGTAVVTYQARDIARCEMGFGDGEANARLIAAAPDLLAAAKLAKEALFASADDVAERGYTVTPMMALDALCAAIARAESR